MYVRDVNGNGQCAGKCSIAKRLSR